MKTHPTIYRQGDVLLRKLDATPSNLQPKSKGSLVILAHGEATGHHHSIPRAAADDFTTGENSGSVVVVKSPTALTHQEHSAIPLEPGAYDVRRQREYSPAAIRNVAD